MSRILDHSQYADGVIARNGIGHATFATGTTVPADATAGYEIGCLFLDVDAAAGYQVWFNEGTSTSAAFKALGGGQRAVVLATTRAVLASENNFTFYLDLAAGFVVTLPAAALGLNYEFVVKTAPTGSYTIVCPAAATLFKGQVLTNDVNSATDSDFGTSGEATITLVLNKAVAGDWVRVRCDGTNWHVTSGCSVFDAITIS